MGGVYGPGGIVDHKGFIGCHGLLELHPFDGFISHVRGEVIVFIVLFLHFGHTIKNDWIPLIGFAANESIKLVKTRICRPTEERAWNRYFPGSRFVPFTESSSTVSVLAQCLSNIFGIIRPSALIPRISGRNFHHRPDIHGMMIPSGKKWGACWWA